MDKYHAPKHTIQNRYGFKKPLKRAYVTDETDERVDKYARNKGLIKQDGYEEIIRGALDEKGNPRAGVVLTETQIKAINDVAAEMGTSPAKVAQDLVNYALLIFGTRVSLGGIIVSAAPMLMDNLVETSPEIAKEILQGLKSKTS